MIGESDKITLVNNKKHLFIFILALAALACQVGLSAPNPPTGAILFQAAEPQDLGRGAHTPPDERSIEQTPKPPAQLPYQAAQPQDSPPSGFPRSS